MVETGPARRPSGWRRLARSTQRTLRRPGAASRPLPDFLVVGAQKAGTTSLLDWLAGHPAVMPATAKEPHFFDLHFERGEDWYRTHFPHDRRRGRVEAVHGASRAGEATPSYLFHPLVPSRAAACLPDARLVALLRDPVARAHSHWRHERRAGRETRPFDEVVGDELASLARGERPDPASPDFRRQWYVSRGFYAEQLARWLEQFPPSQLLVLWSDELFADPATGYAAACRHLGLEPVAPSAGFGARNRDLTDGPSIEPRIASRLREVYAGPDADLAALLGRPPSWADPAR
jgi:hypothetical protein